MSLGEKSEIVQAIRFVEDRLGPADTLEVEITLPPGTVLEDPRTLTAIDRFAEAVVAEEGIEDATSVLNLIRWVNRLLHDDDPGFQVAGDTRSANGEILELVGFDDPVTLANWVSLDRRRLRVSFDAPELPFVTTQRLSETVARTAALMLPAGSQVNLSGEVAITTEWILDVQQTQLRSFPTAFALVFAMVAIFFRSLRLAVAAMVPTLLPVVVVLGTMGWVGMSLDVGRAMIAAVIIGIGVDDSIHLLSQ